MITNILAYIDGRDSAENAAEVAFQLAIRHAAHIEGLHVRADPREFITNAPICSSPARFRTAVCAKSCSAASPAISWPTPKCRC